MHKNYNLRCTRAVRVAGLSTKTLSVTGINSKICPFKKDMWEMIDYARANNRRTKVRTYISSLRSVARRNTLPAPT